jgi:hypothetical protein
MAAPGKVGSQKKIRLTPPGRDQADFIHETAIMIISARCHPAPVNYQVEILRIRS